MSKWIKNAIKPSAKGKLHGKLNVPTGEKIPEKKLNKALHSKSPSLRKEANLAKTLKSFHKRKV